jgi:iron(III) transport system ATP-binding protein
MVFQDYALWPHMTIAGNVAFPLEMRGMARAERRARVAQALARVGLTEVAGRTPSQLSGGQQQRTAVARAIVAEPSLVLFDEPLSNLDRELREALALELSDLIRRLGLTAVYVTHDQGEAFVLADRILLMRDGRLVQDAAPEDLVRAPIDPEAAAFLDLGALVHADRLGEQWRLRGADVALTPSIDLDNAASAQILIPRHAASLTALGTSRLSGTVVRSAFRGAGYDSVVRLDLGGPELTVRVPLGARPIVGERVGIALDPDALRWFPPARGQGDARVS